MKHTENGKETGGMIPEGANEAYLTDTLTGILKNIPDPDDVREKRLKEKYGSAD